LWPRPQSVSRACPALLLLCKRSQNKNQAQTADNQANAKSDRLTTQKLRKAIMADKSLSTYAHNVKIITTDGALTLKGPVQSG
jgi:osmotically-inducible protein OsmY